MTLQNKLRTLYEPFLTLSCDVRHFKRQFNFPYVVWAEDGESDSFDSDNRKTEQTITGTVDLFTKTEFDPLADDVQRILDEEGVAWSLTTVQYEDDTNLIHYTWRWEISWQN